MAFILRPPRLFTQLGVSLAKRALLILDSLHHSGLATQARLLAGRLAAKGFEPHFGVLSSRGSSGAALHQTAPVEILGRRHTPDPIAAWKLRRYAQLLQPTIVHAWGAAAADYAPRVEGARMLVTLGRSSHDRSAGRRWLDRLAMRRADLVVATSDAIAAELSTADALVIQPGVETSAGGATGPNPGERRELLENLQMPANARLVLIVAQLAPRKAVKELVWITDLLRVMHDNVRFLVVGHGPQASSLGRYARLVCTKEHVRMLGPRDDMPELLRHADAYWHAGDETSPPVALLEAMAARVPVVADETIGCRQAITADQNGLLVPPAQRAIRARATEQLLQDAELAERLTTAARQTVEREFSADRMVDAYANAYRAVLS